MTTYLARYVAGEHEPVWRELGALGPRIREEPLYGDAVAVARETMSRVRHNVALLAERLRGIGYEFVYPDRVLTDPSRETLEVLATLEREAGPIPLALRVFYETVGSVCFMGSHPALSEHARGPDLAEMVRSTWDAYAREFGAPAPDPAAEERIAEMLRRVGREGSLPPEMMGLLGQAAQLSRLLGQRALDVAAEAARRMTEGAAPGDEFERTRRLAETLGGAIQGAPMPAPAAGRPPVSDPLVVWPPTEADLDAYRHYGDDDEELDEEPGGDDADWTGRYAIDIAPDAYHKANQSGGGPYQVLFPDPAIDARVEGADYGTFVEYLRECFRWGGFPGLPGSGVAPPAEELAFLTRDLLPV